MAGKRAREEADEWEGSVEAVVEGADGAETALGEPASVTRGTQWVRVRWTVPGRAVRLPLAVRMTPTAPSLSSSSSSSSASASSSSSSSCPPSCSWPALRASVPGVRLHGSWRGYAARAHALLLQLGPDGVRLEGVGATLHRLDVMPPCVPPPLPRPAARHPCAGLQGWRACLAVLRDADEAGAPLAAWDGPVRVAEVASEALKTLAWEPAQALPPASAVPLPDGPGLVGVWTLVRPDGHPALWGCGHLWVTRPRSSAVLLEAAALQTRGHGLRVALLEGPTGVRVTSVFIDARLEKLNLGDLHLGHVAQWLASQQKK